MSDDATGVFRHPVSAEAIRRSPEYRLRYPGEEEVWSDGVDEGVGTGFDNLDKSAVVQRWSRVEARFEDVVEWYASALAERGWQPQPKGWFQRRNNTEVIAIIARRPGYGMWVPPGGYPKSGTVFEFSYRVAPGGDTGPEVS